MHFVSLSIVSLFVLISDFNYLLLLLLLFGSDENHGKNNNSDFIFSPSFDSFLSSCYALYMHLHTWAIMDFANYCSNYKLQCFKPKCISPSEWHTSPVFHDGKWLRSKSILSSYSYPTTSYHGAVIALVRYKIQRGYFNDHHRLGSRWTLGSPCWCI